MVKSYSNWEYYPKFEFVSILLEKYLAFDFQRHYLCSFWFVVKIYKFHNPKYESSKLMV